MTESNSSHGSFGYAGSWRSTHRSRSHESAHAEENLTETKVPEHPLVPQGHAEIVSDDLSLRHLIDHLRDSGSFAYDSEFIGELTYIPKLCLIQVASTKRIALIDPLANVDLRPFWELLCDPTVEKIVHAGQQDVEPVIRHIGREPANLFDTQISAGFIGFPYPVALSKLVGEMTGVKLGKGLTFSHWDKRPLSGMQLRYAADDVRYLPAVRVQIGMRLDALEHTAWAKEECQTLCNTTLYQFDPDTQYLKIRGANGMGPRNLAVLRELVIWRDGVARLHDVPPRALVRDEILVDMARRPVDSIEKLAHVRGLPRPVEETHGKEIVEATQRAIQSPTASMAVEKSVEPTIPERFGADSLWAIAQSLCAGQSIDPALVTSRQEIGELYRSLLAGAETADLRIMQGWRKEALGQSLLELFKGNIQALLRWENGSLRASTQKRPG